MLVILTIVPISYGIFKNKILASNWTKWILMRAKLIYAEATTVGVLGKSCS